jgi:hypothetical protein
MEAPAENALEERARALGIDAAEFKERDVAVHKFLPGLGSVSARPGAYVLKKTELP